MSKSNKKNNNKQPKLVVLKGETQSEKQNTPKKSQKPKKQAKPRKRLNIKKLLLIMLAVILVIAVSYIITRRTSVFISDEDKLFSTEFGVNSKADFCTDGQNVFYCTKDIATLLNKKGETMWSDTFSMVSPVMLNDGNYMGVADVKNKLLNVYNKTGKVYSVETEGNITSFAINPLGATAVICKNSKDNDYNVVVYNSTGQKMFMGSYVSRDGVPMTVDISDDSSKVAVGFINSVGMNITSNVLFYSTDKSVAATIENSDAMFAAVNCEKEMVGLIKFLNNDSCVIATDKSIVNIGGKDVAAYEQNWRHDFSNYVTAIDVVGNDYVAVAYGDSLEANEEPVEKNSVYWYNVKNGNVKGSTVIEMAVSKLSSGLGTTLAELEDNSYVALKPSGSEIWRYKGIQNINNILFYGDTDTIAVVSSTKMTLTDVKTGAENQEKIEDETEAKKEPQTEVQTEQSAKAQTEQATESLTKSNS